VTFYVALEEEFTLFVTLFVIARAHAMQCISQ